MKKSLIYLLFGILSTTTVYSQTLVASYKPVDSKYNWGYLDEKGEIIISPSYKGAFDFCKEGIAPVFDLDTDTWSYIDLKGNKLNVNLKGFEPNNVFGFGRTGFREGLAVLVVKKMKGVIDLTGKIVFTPEFDFISPFNNGFASAKKKKEYFILSKNGEQIPINEVVLEIKKINDGLAIFKAKTKLFGYVNTKGEVAIEPKFLKAGHFVNGIAWAMNSSKKAGYINKAGEWVIEPSYLAAKDMDSETGLARVKSEKGWLFVSRDGDEIRANGAISYGDFNEGLAYARKGDAFGFINRKGEWVIEPVYLKVKNFQEGYSAVRKGSLWGFIDKKGNVIFKEEAKAVRMFNNGYAAIANANGLWGVINTNGKWVIKPQYTKMKDFHLVK